MTVKNTVGQALVILFGFYLVGCKNKGTPDVSHINVEIKIGRFEQLLFAKPDTADIPKKLQALQSAFPYFTNDFITNILGLPGVNAQTPDSEKTFTYSELRRFILLTKPLNDSLGRRFADMDDYEKKLTSGFKYVKFYFPQYKIPNVVTYIGPFDAPAVAVTTEALAIGLQLYAGKDFSFYTSAQGQELYPAYISRRFQPEYIAANCMQAVTEDVYPDKSGGRALIDQIIEKGKQWYLTEKFLPGEHDTLRTGYTRTQLDWCQANEGLIWNFILQGSDIYTTEPDVIKTFLGEAPTTLGMPESSPGNIGQWVGSRIVQTYASKHPEIILEKLLSIDAREIFSGSKYKPR